VSKLTTDVVTYCTEASNQKIKICVPENIVLQKKHWQVQSPLRERSGSYRDGRTVRLAETTRRVGTRGRVYCDGRRPTTEE